MLILASASPRRHEILEAAGIEHVVQAVSIRETRLSDELPRDFVLRLAQEKARAVSNKPGDIVLGADTVVAFENEIFGKPRDRSDAASMLRRLSGREHRVYTGICLRSENRQILDVAETRVNFFTLSENEIEEYTRSGEPIDKAGAYGIQGRASTFVASIEGSYHNVVGLPISLVYQHLKSL